MRRKAFILPAVMLLLLLCPMSASAEESCTHQYGEWILTKVPTCTEQGEVSRTCSVCGDVQVNTVAKSVHTESDWTLSQAPKVGVAGSMQKSCTVCGEVLQTQELAPLPETEPQPEPAPDANVEQPQREWIEITLPVAISICLLPNLVLVIVLLIRKIRRKMESKYFD